YRSGSLVATSGVLAQTQPHLTFLPSGYNGLVDEVRVIALGTSMTAAGSPWIMDDVSFADGPTPNDADDSDDGANKLQNFPVIASATAANGQTSVPTNLVSTPNAAFTIEFFVSPTCGPSGPAGGMTHVATSTIAGNQSGNISIPAVFGTQIPDGQFI